MMKILVIGGYGNFGKRLVASLIGHYAHEIIIAGRSLKKANQLQKSLAAEVGKSPEAVYLDVFSDQLNDDIINLSVDLVVNASGPYQYQTGKNNYLVARACLLAGCHYIDLADDRSFVSAFAKNLDELAKQKELVFITGASTVPALPCAVLDHFESQFSKLEAIDYGISPGNRTERGPGTVASILSYTGQRFKVLQNGQNSQVFGWQGLRRYDFGQPLGKRWMSHCDIPDLDLLPKRYPSLQSIRFQAGLEVSLLHLGLWFLSGVSRWGLIKNWNRYAKPLIVMSEWFRGLGSDAGGMFVELSGIDHQQKPHKVVWQLLAENGVGPNVPCIAAEIIIQKIDQQEIEIGARPCAGLFNLSEFFNIAKRWGIEQKQVNKAELK